MNGFSYVYILQSESFPSHFYIAHTDDLQDRLARHNRGDVPHTSKHAPWRVKTAVAFRDREKAAAFERYLKSPSGRAFAKKRL
jgi:predicted GIY-YIG superfamily endonuclease